MTGWRRQEFQSILLMPTRTTEPAGAVERMTVYCDNDSDRRDTAKLWIRDRNSAKVMQLTLDERDIVDVMTALEVALNEMNEQEVQK